MRILLLGEYSNVHNTLAQGLRSLGHEVTVASNGDFWKNYPRDVDLARSLGKLGGFRLWLKWKKFEPRIKDYDVVQLINPMFLELKAERLFPIFHNLRHHAKCLVLGAMGMDYYWVKTCIEQKLLRYSDFNLGNQLRDTADTRKEIADWCGKGGESTPAKGLLNKLIAQQADSIVAGLYEYNICYNKHFPEKTRFVPLPIALPETTPQIAYTHSGPVRVFIGIQRTRNEYKGTDIMLQAAEQLQQHYPQHMTLIKAENVPFEEYQRMMDSADVLLDQLYSYTPSMNTLLAMSKGIVCLGGGEPENYDILGEEKLRPIINVAPHYESVYAQLRELILNPDRLPQLKRESIEYVRRHHDFLKVARQYEKIYRNFVRE